MEEGLKVYAVIRTDLGMSKGKICAQTAHAVLGLYKELLNYDPVAFAQWSSLDFTQATFEAPDSLTLFRTQSAAQGLGHRAYIVHDAGRTQIAAHTPTVCAFGPCSQEVAWQVLRGKEGSGDGLKELE